MRAKRGELIPAVVLLGRGGSEQLRADRVEFHSWLAEELFNVECSPTGRWATNSLTFSEITEAPEQLSTGLKQLLTRASARGGTKPEVFTLDLSVNPYSFFREKLLASVAGVIVGWLKRREHRHAVVLMPNLPPSRSLFWTELSLLPRNLSHRSLVVISNDGTQRVLYGDCPEIGLDRYEQRRRSALRPSLRDVETFLTRKKGHFFVASEADPNCATSFFIGASATLSEILEVDLAARIGQQGAIDTLLVSAAHSPWLQQAARGVADSLHSQVLFLTGAEEDIGLSSGTRVALLVDVIRTGASSDAVVDTLDQLGVKLVEPVVAVVADTQTSGAVDGVVRSRTTPSTRQYQVEALLWTDTETSSRDECIQCHLGLPRRAALGSEPLTISTFEFWSHALMVDWPAEPYGPERASWYQSAPDFGELFHVAGDWVAYKIDNLLKHLNLGPEVIVVYPQEPHVEVLVDALRPLLSHRLVAIAVPRETLTQVGEGRMPDPTRSRALWARQLNSVRSQRGSRAPVVLLDEFVSSGATVRQLQALLQNFSLESRQCVCVLNRNPSLRLKSMKIFSLYEISSPRTADAGR